ncbi:MULTISPECIES: hypothetical protein [Salinibaculum]|uniref:hypothetical protein n=1 Tax=Salinibaculum TaxID=2732368 RepID=UPI0030CE430E
MPNKDQKATLDFIEETIESPDDHNRAAREIALAVAERVDEVIESNGHPVDLTIEMEISGHGGDNS